MASGGRLTKGQAQKRLGIGRLNYDRYIESGILPAPISLCDGARPFHTESQIEIAENNLHRRAVAALQPESGRKMKPLSKKFISEIS